MTYFPESVIITTIDGIQFKTFSNEHPADYIIAKPKYIPIQEVYSKNFLTTNIFNREFNRLNLWEDKTELKYYLDFFFKSYPGYRLFSKDHQNWFFAIPRNRIKQIFDPREGLKQLMELPTHKQDLHIISAIQFVKLLLKSGVSIEDLGITFSTLVGYYDPRYSDLNIIIYGKANGWKVINFLNSCKDKLLRWKTKEEWEKFRQRRNRKNIFSREEFLNQMSRKKTEGFFNNILFVLFNVEKENELWQKLGSESYESLGIAEVEGVVIDNYNSLIRPGYYEIKNSKILKGKKVQVKKIVFYSRDYVMQASPKERIRACGLLEKVTNRKTNKTYYRLVIGYFDAYLNERREKEYIKKI